MGVGVGLFRMTKIPSTTADLANLQEQEIDLDEAYAQSSNEDKLLAMDFKVALGDGLADTHSFRLPTKASNHDS